MLTFVISHNLTLASTQKVNAVLKNETQQKVKVRIESKSGYSVFGIAPRNVFTEYVDRTARLTVMLQNGRALLKSPLMERRDAESKFDRTHDAVYVRIQDNKIELIVPKDARGWWSAGLPARR